MEIIIAGTTVTCDITGSTPTVVQLPGFNGFFTCPPKTICESTLQACPGSCYGNGTCTFDKCDCDDGFYGDDCLGKCDLSCKTCSGPGDNECDSCNTGLSFNSSTGGCDCDSSTVYVVPTGECVSSLSNCPDRYISNGTACDFTDPTEDDHQHFGFVMNH